MRVATPSIVTTELGLLQRLALHMVRLNLWVSGRCLPINMSNREETLNILFRASVVIKTALRESDKWRKG